MIDTIIVGLSIAIIGILGLSVLLLYSINSILKFEKYKREIKQQEEIRRGRRNNK